MTRIEFEARLRAKAWKDPEFQARLLAEPKQTLEAELLAIEEGVALPADLKIRVVEESAGEICLVIPRHPAHVAGRPLSDQELDAVAGGAVSQSDWDSTGGVNPATETTTVLDACSVVTCMESAVIGSSF